MSLALSGIGIGGSLLSPVITYFISTYGWRFSYRAVGAMVIIISVPVAFLLLKSKPSDMGLLPLEEKPGDGKEKTKAAAKPENDNKDVDLNRAKSKPYFYMHLLGMLLLGLICSAPLRQISPFVEDMHGASAAALIVSMYSFVGIFGKLILGVINDKLGSMKGACVAFFLMAIGFILLLFGQNMVLLYVMTLFYGVGNGVGTVSAPLIISATFGKKNFNFMRGLTQSPMQLGMSLGGLMVAFTYDLSGSYISGWILCIILTFFAMACFVYSYVQARKE